MSFADEVEEIAGRREQGRRNALEFLEFVQGVVQPYQIYTGGGYDETNRCGGEIIMLGMFGWVVIPREPRRPGSLDITLLTDRRLVHTAGAAPNDRLIYSIGYESSPADFSLLGTEEAHAQMVAQAARLTGRL